MAAKRLRDESPNRRDDKRLRKLPSFWTVIRDVVMTKSLQNFCLALEPLLRRVVQEEVERGLIHGARLLQKSALPPRKLQAVESSTSRLTFKRPPLLPIFTSTKIEDVDGNPLQLLLVEDRIGKPSPADLLPSIKVELVAMNGDFPGVREEWTSAEFNNNIIRAREGKRPLLIGDISVTLKDGAASIEDLSFTDNSSWTRSRNFRIGARVVPGSYDGPRIVEAITDRFTVKDHRGELYRKHYPPRLDDEVWRLEKIGKDGAFHNKLAAANINSVQEFLRLSVVNPNQLRVILGLAMSDRMWEVTMSHARTCELGERRYLFRGSCCAIVLNPICEAVGVLVDGYLCKIDQLNAQQRAYVQRMAQEAYFNWNKVEVFDGFFGGNTALIPEAAGPAAGSSAWYSVNEDTALELQIGPDEAPPLETQFSLDALVGFRTLVGIETGPGDYVNMA